MRGLLMCFVFNSVFDDDGNNTELNRVSYTTVVTKEGETPDDIVWSRTVNDITKMHKQCDVFNISLFDYKDKCPVDNPTASAGYDYSWEDETQVVFVDVWYVFVEAEPDHTL